MKRMIQKLKAYEYLFELCNDIQSDAQLKSSMIRRGIKTVKGDEMLKRKDGARNETKDPKLTAGEDLSLDELQKDALVK